MKRIMAAVLTGILCCMLLAGCHSSDTDEKAQSSSMTATSVVNTSSYAKSSTTPASSSSSIYVEKVKENACEIADAFTNNDMASINKIVFGSDEFETDEELSDIWDNPTESKADGILKSIFDLATVKVGQISESTIEYEIEAPDMTNVFTDLIENATDMSEDELLEYMKDYAKNAELKTYAVSLDYTFEDNETVVNYQDESFINAVTGGLLDAYKNLYAEMIEEYLQEEEK